MLAEVNRFYVRYAEAVDAADEPALRGLLAPEVSITRGGARVQGVEEFLDVYRAHWGQGIGLCQHQVTNVDARVVPGRVRATAYFRALFFEELQTRLVVGRYEDDLVPAGPGTGSSEGGLAVFHKRNVVQRAVVLPKALIIP